MNQIVVMLSHILVERSNPVGNRTSVLQYTPSSGTNRVDNITCTSNSIECKRSIVVYGEQFLAQYTFAEPHSYI